MSSTTITTGESAEQSAGVRVIALLGVLTTVEYAFALAVGASVLLLAALTPIALVKAWLIVTYFMRLPRAWRGEEATQ